MMRQRRAPRRVGVCSAVPGRRDRGAWSPTTAAGGRVRSAAATARIAPAGRRGVTYGGAGQQRVVAATINHQAQRNGHLRHFITTPASGLVCKSESGQVGSGKGTPPASRDGF